ncbi:50S ribosomal protein L23 [Candidatus Micrarchaeota archaeon]|nr:50S ribosomal protein L23 [Candidatus Micrarchaeota archaeon]
MAVKYALTTEKAVARIDKDNELVFVVDEKATKPEIKSELEASYQEKIRSVRTLHDMHGKKKAIVLFERKGAAADLAAKLKVI